MVTIVRISDHKDIMRVFCVPSIVNRSGLKNAVADSVLGEERRRGGVGT